MHAFPSLLAGVCLLSFASAIPVDKRDIGYGDRSDYLAEYWAHQSSGASYYPSNPPNGPQPSSHPTGAGGWNGQPPQPTGAPAPPPAPPSNTGAGGSGGVVFPLSNGFPDIANPSSQLSAINQAAHGTLSNAPPPAKAVGPDTLTSLQLVAFNEIFEVFFFTYVLQDHRTLIHSCNY
jgi:hypothetical protein